MKVRRGDVILAFYPFSSGAGGKRRPVLVVQADRDNARMRSTLVAQITTNLARSAEATHFLIEAQSADGSSAGLLHDSVVSCNNLATILEERVEKVVGRLTPAAMDAVDLCLKAALDLS
jgi:mRNA interferase MazF